MSNRDDFSGLVLADTLLLNKDRFPGIIDGNPNYDNLLFTKASRGTLYEIIAMDFSHCMHSSTMICKKLTMIDTIKNETIVGAFPEFSRYLTLSALRIFKERLKLLDENKINSILSAIPPEWELNTTLKGYILTFLVQRASFLYDNIERMFESVNYEP